MKSALHLWISFSPIHHSLGDKKNMERRKTKKQFIIFMINAKHFYAICLSYNEQIHQQEKKTDSEKALVRNSIAVWSGLGWTGKKNLKWLHFMFLCLPFVLSTVYHFKLLRQWVNWNENERLEGGEKKWNQDELDGSLFIIEHLAIWILSDSVKCSYIRRTQTFTSIIS